MTHNPGLWNPVYAAQGFRNPTNSDWNPESKYHLQGLESNTWNPESTARNPESKTVLVLLIWGESGFMKRQVLFFNGRKEAPPRKESNIFVTVIMILANVLIIKHKKVSSAILIKVN